jgi:Fic family protein
MLDLLKSILDKKRRLDSYKPIPKGQSANMDVWYKIELTYSSNAIEGNTLTRQETAQVVEKGITVKGKSITEHLEAINHAEAYEYIRSLNLKSTKDINKRIILDIHSILLKNIDSINAGIFRNIPVRIAGSTVILPNPIKVPELMDEFISWLNKDKDNIIQLAVDAHFRLVTIHPFTDGNGRLGRLLMNLVLMTNNYPPTIIRKEDRKEYIDSIEKGQLTNDLSDYYSFMFRSVDRSLGLYLKTLEGKTTNVSKQGKKLLKIGELATETSESTATIRYWIKEKLVPVKEITQGGYQLFDYISIKRIKEIRKLQKEKRLTIAELRELFVS